VMVCDKQYTEKANERKGGVGTEAQIISPEIFSKQDQMKFVAVLPERDGEGNPFLPVYYGSRKYIDLSSTARYQDGFEQLLRWIYDKPLHRKPALGQKPAFLEKDISTSLQTSVEYNRALRAIHENKANATALVCDYFEAFTGNLEQFRIIKDDEPFDEKVVNNIEEFRPYRDEAIKIIKTLSCYQPTRDSWDAMHSFFESLIPYLFRSDEMRSYQEKDFDNFKFIVHELFLYTVALLLRNECFDGVAHLVRQHYYVADIPIFDGDGMESFSVMRQSLNSLEERNKRLNLNRRSLHADFLASRSKNSILQYQYLMQADYVLLIRDFLDSSREGRFQKWWPVTLLYASRQYRPFEVFMRSRSAKYFDNFKQVFDIETKESLSDLEEAFRSQKIQIPYYTGRNSAFSMIGYDKLATLP